MKESDHVSQLLVEMLFELAGKIKSDEAILKNIKCRDIPVDGFGLICIRETTIVFESPPLVGEKNDSH